MKKKANGFFKFLLIALLVIAFMLVLDQVILIDNETSTVGAELRTRQFMQRFYGIVPDDALPETEWMLLKPESLKKKNEFVFAKLDWGMDYQTAAVNWPYELTRNFKVGQIPEGWFSHGSRQTRTLAELRGDVYLDFSREDSLKQVRIVFAPEDPESWYEARYREFAEAYGPEQEQITGNTGTGACWKGKTTFLQLLKTEEAEGTRVVLVLGAQ